MRKRESRFFVWIFGVLLFLFPQISQGAPQGGSVISGRATILQNATTTLINQATDKVIINWQKFGIKVNEGVQFIQPSTLAAALNRVTGMDPSVILGSLKANGRIFLVNPNGILFGKTATVDVGSLLATTLNIKNSDFLNGNYAFSQDPGKPLSFVVNEGTITASSGGFVALLAPLVDNEGTITANQGSVALGAATKAVLSFDSHGTINLSLSENSISHDVVLTSDAYTEALSKVVNNKNILQAASVIYNPDGSVTITGASGTLVHAGTIAANGAPGKDAGSVLLSATQAIALPSGSLIQANGQGANSNGGNVQVLSQGMLAFDGAIEAKGGESGNGGTVNLFYYTGWSNGTIDASAPHGSAGTITIDPPGGNDKSKDKDKDNDSGSGGSSGSSSSGSSSSSTATTATNTSTTTTATATVPAPASPPALTPFQTLLSSLAGVAINVDTYFSTISENGPEIANIPNALLYPVDAAIDELTVGFLGFGTQPVNKKKL